MLFERLLGKEVTHQWCCHTSRSLQQYFAVLAGSNCSHTTCHLGCLFAAFTGMGLPQMGRTVRLVVVYYPEYRARYSRFVKRNFMLGAWAAGIFVLTVRKCLFFGSRSAHQSRYVRAASNPYKPGKRTTTVLSHFTQIYSTSINRYQIPEGDTAWNCFLPNADSDARDCFFLDDNLLHVLGVALGGVPAYMLSKKLKGVHDAFRIREEMTQTMGLSSACVGGPK